VFPRTLVTLACAVIGAAAPLAAQDRDPAPDRTIDAAERRTWPEVRDDLRKKLR
jgi:hypothetical protein